MPSTANYLVYRDYPNWGAYNAVNASGHEIAANPHDPQPVIQAALNQAFWNDPSSGPGAGYVFVQSGNYVFQAGFSGLDVLPYTRLVLDPTARLAVPTGYGGFVFRMRSRDGMTIAHSCIDGGQLTEQGSSPQRQWTALLLDAATSTSAGIMFNRLQNTIIFNAAIGLRLHVSGQLDFINANRFEFLRMWHCRRFVSFQIDPPYQAGQQNLGIIGNTFEELECQSDGNLAVGIDGISGAYNSFFDVRIWDVRNQNPNALSAVITPQADHTRIFGGFLAGGPPGQFVDKGVATQLVAAT